MTATDSRLSATHELVSRDGPRALWRRAEGGAYVAICIDCGGHYTDRHRIDAEDWLDGHDCTSDES